MTMLKFVQKKNQPLGQPLGHYEFSARLDRIGLGRHVSNSNPVRNYCVIVRQNAVRK